MPDPRRYPYEPPPEQVGPNAYKGALYDALRSRETVDVVGTEPEDPPAPMGLDEIYLGTETSKPTGTFTPEYQGPATVDPRAKPSWDRVTKRYPYMERFVRDVKVVDPKELGADWAGAEYRHPGTVLIREGQENDDRILLHEGTHAAQFNQFPDAYQSEAQSQYMGRAPQRKAEGGNDDAYLGRRGEQLAFESEHQASRTPEDKQQLWKEALQSALEEGGHANEWLKKKWEETGPISWPSNVHNWK